MSETDPPIRILFETLTGLERPEDRLMFLDFTCREDPELRTRLERLLKLRHEAQDFFDIETAPSDREAKEENAGPPEADDATEGVGSKIGRYRLLERIGEGGCGAVYLAEQLEPVKRRVALKITRLGMDTENVIARFEMERQALAMMDHPNIARVFDVGATRTGRPFFVMQLVDGNKITDYCDSQQLGLTERLKMFIRVCQAIQHAHQKGVIHRDIKPSNILVWVHDGEAAPKVIDFGIAKATGASLQPDLTVTDAGQFLGTPAYMSPEQATGDGRNVDTRSDIYSLGALLFEMLTGVPHVDPASLKLLGADEVRRTLAEMEPRQPSAVVSALKKFARQRIAEKRSCDPDKLAALLKGDLDRIVMMAMAREPRHRYPTADALAADVARYLNHEPVVARPPSRRYRFEKLVRRNRSVFASVGVVLLSLLIGLGLSTWMYLREMRARNAAEIARANEAALRQKAEIGEKIARAAVFLKYRQIEEADALVSHIPPPLVHPSQEGAETFRVLGLWHAKEGRWMEAGNRFAALSYSIAGVDESDLDAISIQLLPAAATICEVGNLTEYQHLRNMAVKRFGGTANPVVAEQVMKACLLMPAEPEFLARLGNFESLLISAESRFPAATWNEMHLAAWRGFAMALMKFRQGRHDAALGWIAKCLEREGWNQARDAMCLTLRAMIRRQRGQLDEAAADLEAARALVSPQFSPEVRIFDQGEPQWQDWLNAKIMLREADALAGK
jgi:serine/threonine protein kinase